MQLFLFQIPKFLTKVPPARSYQADNFLKILMLAPARSKNSGQSDIHRCHDAIKLLQKLWKCSSFKAAFGARLMVYRYVQICEIQFNFRNL